MVDEIVDRALRLYPGRDHRVGMRSAYADAACICDAFAKRVEAANPGRGRGSVSQVGQAIADAVRKAGDQIMAARERIVVEPLPTVTGNVLTDEERAARLRVLSEAKAAAAGGIVHADDSPLLTRRVPRFERPTNPEDDGA